MPKPHPDQTKAIEPYEHKGKQRVNNPPVGLVDTANDPPAPQKTYTYDPHIDPALQWSGKAEHVSFDVPTVSLHVHERIDPRTIIQAVRRQEKQEAQYQQMSLFHKVAENPPLREAIEFYKHRHGWSNRLISGDSLVVMNSLLEKEGLAGQVQMIYLDPPYGIKYGSNFQPFTNKRDVKDGKDDDLNQEPEMIKAFRDTWELGIHSYLTYLRDRLLLARELLSETGSIFVQIGNENTHLVRNLLDEVFGKENLCAAISYRTTGAQTSKFLPQAYDHLLWYAKDITVVKYRQVFIPDETGSWSLDQDLWLELGKECRRMTSEEKKSGILPQGARLFRHRTIEPKSGSNSTIFPIQFNNKTFTPKEGKGWSTNEAGIQNLIRANRLLSIGNTLRYVIYRTDFPYRQIGATWEDTMISGFSDPKAYVVQTAIKVIERCLMMTTDPGDLVIDPTCGSGTTAFVAEQWGRRWITCDTSRVAITLAKQRLMTSLFEYYELVYPNEGVGSGFKYKTVPHITLKSLANNEPTPQETLYDQPNTDKNRARITGPFTVEAVPAPTVKPLSEIESEPASDASITRSGETLRQSQWREELLQTGIRGKGGSLLKFSRVEPLPGTRHLHADAETRPSPGEAGGGDGGGVQRAVISFGPTFAPLEQKQVEQALEEAAHLMPRPKIIVFAAFQFDSEAAKDIDETRWPGVTLLKAQMNTDLLTEDLKKKRSSNESFWLIGQPDARLSVIASGEQAGKYQVEVAGFDYYNPKTGAIESGGVDKIAVWMLDTDYDGRSLFPRQVFFPMAGEKDGWARLAKNLKAEIDEERIEAFRGTLSLPFEPGKERRVAVKVVDDRGIESLKVIKVE